jgi:ABC-type transporter Mla maintaining outer membrane lipid asymmetry ATPase subunit MlaF
MVPYPSNLSGGANRRSPTGGFAYGIPKYPEIFQFDWNATAHIPFMSNNVKILSFMLIEKAKNIMLTGLFVQDVNSIFDY